MQLIEQQTKTLHEVIGALRVEVNTLRQTEVQLQSLGKSQRTGHEILQQLQNETSRKPARRSPRLLASLSLDSDDNLWSTNQGKPHNTNNVIEYTIT